MSRGIDASQLQVGDDVFGSDGEKVGTVAEVQRDYLVVEKGFFFPTDYYIPFSAVATAGNGEIYLNVSKDDALQSGWETVPELDAMPGGSGIDTGVTDAAWRTSDAARGTSGVTDVDRVVGAPAMAGYETTAEDELRIPVIEEELSATVRPTEAGAVRIEKRVVEEDRVLEVPVTEERVRVERRIVDRPADATDPQAFEEIVIEVPVTAEQVELRKQGRVTEEILVSKEAVQRTEQVRGTVRREEVVVDENTLDDVGLVDRTEGGATPSI
jgi:uncharacterized protein (TIGR02271 family)